MKPGQKALGKISPMSALVMGMSVYAAALLTSETMIAQNNVESGNPSIPRSKWRCIFPGAPDSGEADLEAIARQREPSLERSNSPS
jgi:hypothetical protein